MKQRLILISSALAVVSVCACTGSMKGSRPPPPTELLNARAELQRAQSDPDVQQNPSGLIEARQAIDAAEHEYEHEQKSPDVETLSYVAQRKVEIAEAESRSARLAKENAEKESQAFDRSERRAKVALARLGLAAKEDPRGTVITLPTANMFAVDDAKILPSAQGPLTQITKAVKQVLAERDPRDAGRGMELVGYTDETGTEEHDLALSKRRAEAVRAFFAQHGLDRTTMSVVGKGQADPIADNSTTEGRAKNRRVEIVISHPSTGESPRNEG